MFCLTAYERKVIIGVSILILIGSSVRYYKRSTISQKLFASIKGDANKQVLYVIKPKYTEKEDRLSSSEPVVKIISKQSAYIKKQKIKGPFAYPKKITNINTASQLDLEKIPGVGRITACNIIKYRRQKGLFKAIEELKNIPGIGEKKLARLRNHIILE